MSKYQVLHINELVSFEQGDKFQNLRKNFDCGVLTLNDYLQRYARKNSKEDVGQTWVIFDEVLNQVVGYYTLIACSISRDRITDKFPYKEIPSIKIGRLAVDLKYRGKGIGSDLLYNGFEKILSLSNIIGVAYILVDAKDEKARAFYKNHEFKSFQENSLQMYIKVSFVRKLWETS